MTLRRDLVDIGLNHRPKCSSSGIRRQSNIGQLGAHRACELWQASQKSDSSVCHAGRIYGDRDWADASCAAVIIYRCITLREPQLGYATIASFTNIYNL